MGVVGVRKCMAVRGGDGQGTSLEPWLPETRGGACTVHLVSCSTQRLSQGEELGLGVVSVLVVAAWVIIQARGHRSSQNRHCWLLAGWCMLGLSMGAGSYGLPVGLPMGIPAKTLTCRSRLPVATGP